MPDGLLWPIKASLMSYIESLDDGVVEVVGPASGRDEGFWFPQEDASGTPGPGFVVAYSGSVRLGGHWGMMQLEFTDPRVEFGDDGAAVLLIRESGRTDRFTSLADLTIEDVAHPEGGSTVFTLSAAVSGAGVFLLGSQYPAGTALAPVRIEWAPADG